MRGCLPPSPSPSSSPFFLLSSFTIFLTGIHTHTDTLMQPLAPASLSSHLLPQERHWQDLPLGAELQPSMSSRGWAKEEQAVGEEAMYSLLPASGIPGCQISASYLHRHTTNEVSPKGFFQGRSQAGASRGVVRGTQAGLLLGTVTRNFYKAVEDDSFYDWRARA